MKVSNFDSGYLAHFCQSAMKIGRVRGLAMTPVSRISWTLVAGSRDTTWRVAWVLQWCTC